MAVQLLGPMLGSPEIDASIQGFLMRSPTPDSTEVSQFLSAFSSPSDRSVAAQALIAKGVPAKTVSAALNWLNASSTWGRALPTIKGVATIAAASAATYHGYRRNKSIGWALVWGVLGTIFPVVTSAIALAQGFGQRKAA